MTTMQQIRREHHHRHYNNEKQQQESNTRLARRLPANENHDKLHQHSGERLKTATKSTSNRFVAAQQQTEQTLPSSSHARLHEFDIQQSLSSFPTYSSLSRHSPETRVSSMDVCQ
jgi:hypothetical protein